MEIFGFVIVALLGYCVFQLQDLNNSLLKIDKNQGELLEDLDEILGDLDKILEPKRFIDKEKE